MWEGEGEGYVRPLSPGNPAHSLIEELLEVNEMQVV